VFHNNKNIEPAEVATDGPLRLSGR
jgi:hypothetical protein